MTLQHWSVFLCAAVVVSTQPSRPELTTMTDPAVYAIYGALLDSQLWVDRTDQVLFIVQETRYPPGCRPSKPAPEVWRSAAADFERQNTRGWRLQAPLPTAIRYFLVPRADIEADDEPLARQNPERMQNRPGSVAFAEFSAVGFDADRTRAIVYAHRRDAGGLYVMERHLDRWAVSSGWGCRWVR